MAVPGTNTQRARSGKVAPVVYLCLSAFVSSVSLEVQPHFQLEVPLRRDPVSSRRSLERDVSEWVRVVEIDLRAAINRRGTECWSRRTRRRMIEDVSRIHADSTSETLADFESL